MLVALCQCYRTANLAAVLVAQVQLVQWRTEMVVVDPLMAASSVQWSVLLLDQWHPALMHQQW
jgi:hypothetical protein